MFENKISGGIHGWCLLEIRLSTYELHYRAQLRGKTNSAHENRYEINLPIMRNGRIHELIYIPHDITELSYLLPEVEPPLLSIRRVAWLERVVRMANRVFPAIRRLSAPQRRAVGLTYLKALINLEESYLAASMLRGGVPSYVEWVGRFDLLPSAELRQISKQIDRMRNPPHFYIILLSDDSTEAKSRQTLDSIERQIYRNFTCLAVEQMASEGGGGAANVKELWAERLQRLNTTLTASRETSWLLILKAGKILSPHALYWFAQEASDNPASVAIYADEDKQDASGVRSDPRFKPDWSLEHLRATHFVEEAVVLRNDVVDYVGGVDHQCLQYGVYDLLLRVVDAVEDADRGKFLHIPAVLLHDADAGGGGERRVDWEIASLRAHLARNNIACEVVGSFPGCRRVRYRLPDVLPLVTIIIPTKNATQLIRQCIESLLGKSTYQNFEILVVDNQSTDMETISYLAQIAEYERVKVLPYDSAFNYSAINNFAVKSARGEVLCLLNNDTEVISPDWLEEMVGHLIQPKVGIVGAKLYYPDGRVQHAGDLVGVGGVANHAHAFLPRSATGYCNRAVVAQELTAVTAACMVTWRHLYLKLGGLDEEHLKVAFNDVDYCLRMREAGYRVVWTPHAELYHHESVSRGKDDTPEKRKRAGKEVKYMRARWRKELVRDPFYNPNLIQERADFSLGHAPMIERPWRKR